MSSSVSSPTLITGTVHGKHLDLDQETGLPDGQMVSVVLRPVAPRLPSGEGLRRAFGGWSDDPDGVDKFMEEVRKLRDLENRARDRTMSFVVDTDICSAFLKGERRVISRFHEYMGGLNISTITCAELYSWAYRTAQSPQRAIAVDELLTDINVLPIDREVAQRCGQARADLLDRGIVVAVPDLLIAATALHFNYTVITHNTKHFSLVPGLRLQDWLLP